MGAYGILMSKNILNLARMGLTISAYDVFSLDNLFRFILLAFRRMLQSNL